LIKVFISAPRLVHTSVFISPLVLIPLRIELPIINVLVLWSFGFGTFVALDSGVFSY
jgi:hypothetical protein